MMNHDLYHTPSYFADMFPPHISSVMKDGVDKNPLHVAALIGNIEMVKALVERGVDVNEKSEDGKTAAHYATIGGNFDVLKFLTEHGVDVNVVDRYNLRAIHYAIKRMKGRRK